MKPDGWVLGSSLVADRVVSSAAGGKFQLVVGYIVDFRSAEGLPYDHNRSVASIDELDTSAELRAKQYASRVFSPMAPSQAQSGRRAR